jgi:micrococcal nuclease
LRHPIKTTIWLFIVTAIITGTGNLFAKAWIKVRWVDDGDTVVLIDDRRVRYLIINAPEIAHGKEKAEPYGYAAKKFNSQLVYMNNVRLEYDREKMDRYGRTLAYVFLKNGLFVNNEIVRQGYAYYLPQRQVSRYGKELLKAQQEAMLAKRGIWKNWREKSINRGYLGNKASKRFHLKTCQFGKQTARGNRIYFSSKWEAFWKGFSPGKRCLREYWKTK